MDVINAFLTRYDKEYDFYDQAARLVQERLQSMLRMAGVRCLVTSRAKDLSRLEAKCRRRDRARKYESAEQIFDDIADLAGVRVALYFPGERHQVDGAINNLFRLLESKKEFPGVEAASVGKRFSGYSATHYRVQLKEDELSDVDKRYAVAKVEIQVASVLMHAWSEVEHDLVYKPLEGELSEDEYAILDQLNGMVIAGEIALETLQRAGERRVAESGRAFLNHYELAAHLVSRYDSIADEPVGEAGVGRVDLLYAFLRRLELDTPAQLTPYVETLHGNLEVRPIAEQITDALIAEDKSRYDIFRAIQNKYDRHDLRQRDDRNNAYHQMGVFMSRWGEFESLVRELTSIDGKTSPLVPVFRLLDKLDLVDKDMLREIDMLRRLRNNLVHKGVDRSAAFLAEATQRVEFITGELRRRSSPE